MPERDPILLTPGPLTTSRMTRDAMLRDWGSWDAAFNRLTKSVCADLVRIAGGGDAYVCVPLQGSGTFAVEATLGTLVPRDARVLVPNNGAYCARIAAILRRLGIAHVELPFAEDEPASAHAIDAALARDARLTHVALVHLETSAGLLNPLDDIAAVCRARGKALIVDAMSSFGALPIALAASGIDALISASGKCLEGVPGMGFAIVRRSALEAAEGRSPSVALDLHDQYAYMQRTSQWRFTPPTHVLAALRAALDQFFDEGGQPARGARYARNCATLVDGMRALGFEPFLDARAGERDRHVLRARRSRVCVPGVLRGRARRGLRAVSGQADDGRHVSRRLHRRARRRRDARRGGGDRRRARIARNRDAVTGKQ